VSLASLQLTGKTAVVVGGTSGIGRAISLAWPNRAPMWSAFGARQEQVDGNRRGIEARGPAQNPAPHSATCQGSKLPAAPSQRIRRAFSAWSHFLVNERGQKIKRAPTLTFPEGPIGRTSLIRT